MSNVLTDPHAEPPEEAFAWTRSWKDAPETPRYLNIAFEKGLPVSVDGKPAAELRATRIAEMFEKTATYKLTIRRGEQTLQVPLTPKKMI